jgi:hypothetical protein
MHKKSFNIYFETSLIKLEVPSKELCSVLPDGQFAGQILVVLADLKPSWPKKNRPIGQIPNELNRSQKPIVS